MLKLISGFAALFLYSSFCMASLEANVRHQELPSSASSPSVPNGAEGMISEDERERRVQVCERAFEDCRDWCTRTKGGGSCYAECSKSA